MMRAMKNAQEALAELQAGNNRFVNGTSDYDPSLNAVQRSQLLEGQTPFAVVLGCSDSRVPVEMVFDQGFGDLFVIRVAGNVVASSQIASVEFAAEQFGVRLVVVMGHTNCGAVAATITALTSTEPSDSLSNLRSIVDRIRPAVEGLLDLNLENDQLMKQAVRSNARISANSLRHGSQALERLSETANLLIIGAEYCLETGRVEFFDGLPTSGTNHAAITTTNSQGAIPGYGLLVKLGGEIRDLWIAVARMLNIYK
ncbi:MAG: carbonic anhydrase [Candidatus Azotimanducaceae bacterium]|jgi:carbonic anhydrase